MKRFSKCIAKGVEEPLSSVPFHKDAGIRRLLMLDKRMVPGAGVRVAVHHVKDLPARTPGYCEPHRHDFEEINLILSDSGKLAYRIRLEDEVYVVESPSTVFIPRGVRHSAEAVSGEGMFVCILLSSDYSASR
jgi:2-isopropylmalate synthase